MAAESDFLGVDELHEDARIKWNKMLHKAAEWITSYNYGLKEITAYDGDLYRSTIPNNQGNVPGVGGQWALVNQGGGGGGIVNSVFGVSKTDVLMTDLRVESSVQDGDFLPIFDTSNPGTPHARMTRANLLAGVVRSTIAINTADGLFGGGDLSTSRTLVLNIANGLPFSNAGPAGEDWFVWLDLSVPLHKVSTFSKLFENFAPSIPVTSVHSRVGDVVGAPGDYNAGMVTFSPIPGVAAVNVQSAIQTVYQESLRSNFADLSSVTPALGSLIAVDTGLATGSATISSIIALAEGAVTSVFTRTGAVVAVDGDYDASQVDFTPAGTIVATDVQAAIAELDSEKVPTTRTVTAGVGLLGGGALSANITLNFDIAEVAGFSSGSVVGADNLLVADVSDTNIVKKIAVSDMLALVPAAPVTSVFGRTGAVVPANDDYTASQVAYVPAGNVAATTVAGAIGELDAEKVPNTRTITTPAGSGVSGGGDLTANRTLALDIDGLATGTGLAGTDIFAFHDASVPGLRKVAYSDLLDFGGGGFSSATGVVPLNAQLLIKDGSTLKIATKDMVIPKRSWGQGAAPTSANDSTQGYEQGSLWGWAMDGTGLDQIYVCISATAGDAKWRAITVPRFNATANAVPGVNDDISNRWVQNSLWHWDETGRLFVCTNNADGAAVWSEVGGNYTKVKATLTANATLSAALADIVWGAEADDTFNEFSTSTGKFTAVQEGQYEVEIAMHSADNGILEAELWTGSGIGSVLRKCRVHGSNYVHETYTVDLAAGGILWVKGRQVNGTDNELTDDNNRTYFHIRRVR